VTESDVACEPKNLLSEKCSGFSHSSFRWCSTEFFLVSESTMILQISTPDEMMISLDQEGD
jgi:hypothetical protein